MQRTLIAIAASLVLPLAAAQVPGVDAYFDAMAITVAPGQQSQFVTGDNLAGHFAGATQSVGKGEGYVTREGTQFLDYASVVDGVANDRAHSTEQVLPYGHRVRYPGGATQFVALAANQPFTVDDLTLHSLRPARSFTVVAGFGASAAEAAQRARAASPDPIRAEKIARHAALTRSYLQTSDAEYNKALNWAKASASMFVVEEFGTGIWAGLPWFRDNWGRDTFIALPGTLLVSGQFDQAKAVRSNFARYQNLNEPRDKEYGRIPNRVSASFSFLNPDKSRSRVAFTLAPGARATLVVGARKATLNGRALAVRSAQPSFAGVIGKLGFRTPAQYNPGQVPMLRSKDVLKGIVERGEYR